MHTDPDKCSAEDVFKDLIDTSLVLIDDQPQTGMSDPRSALVGILERILRSEKSGQALPEISTELPISMIPGDVKGHCHPILFGFCYDGDDFSSRLREVLDHAAVLCRGTTRLVVVFTSHWDTGLWKSVYLREFEQIYATVYIYIFGPSGILSHIV